MILLLKQMMVMLKMIDNSVVVEADDGDGDLREWVAKPLFGHPATCSIVGHLAAKLFDQNKRDLSFVSSSCYYLWCFRFVYRLSTCLFKCLLFYFLISDRSELFNSWTLGYQGIRQKEGFFVCVFIYCLIVQQLVGASPSCQAIRQMENLLLSLPKCLLFVCVCCISLCLLFHCLRIRWEPLVQ